MRKCIVLLLLIAGLKSNAQYKIAFNVFEDTAKDNYDIYVINMDGSGRKNITNTSGVEWVYHTYQDRIFFISDRDTCHRCYFLYEMDANGNNVKKLSNLQLEDSWMGSRNRGTEMIVLGRIGRQVRNQLFLIDLKNGSYKQITDDTVSNKRDPIFLPGGKEIVMAYRPDKKLRMTVPDELWKFDFQEEPNGIVSLVPKGKQLTFFPKNDTTTEWFEYHAGPPQWNDKYKFISYLSRREMQSQIYAVTADGKKQWQVTSGNLSSGWHSWSPDGEWLVMDKSTHEGKGFDIYLMNYKTKAIKRITDNWKTEQAPVFVETGK